MNYRPSERIKTGIKNLDEILHGGFLKGSMILLGGTPGAGKTILSQQICFKNATKDAPVIFFQTLSEPTAKTLRYLRQFEFFDLEKIEDGSVRFIDLGEILRGKGLAEASKLFNQHIKKYKPAFVVIDSFKVFSELSESREDLRKFSYEVAINLMAWECTSFLLGEFKQDDLDSNPLTSIVDGVVMITVEERSGEQQRFIQVSKMRGTDHSRDKHALSISKSGIDVYSPKVTIRREPLPIVQQGRIKTGITGLDNLMKEGLQGGTSILLAGVSGTGKTTLALETIYRGARDYNERGIFVSFEETEERLIRSAKTLGWDLEKEIERGMVEIIFIPQPEILVEKHLQYIHQRIEKFGAKRLAIDSLSSFLFKIEEPNIVRERVFHLATLIQRMGGLGILTSDIPYGSPLLSRYGVEATVLDGIIILSTLEVGLSREAYLEVYKMRNSEHSKGRHAMKIGKHGVVL